MPRKGMRSLCFSTSSTSKTQSSYSMSDHSPSPSTSSLSRSMERSIATAEPLIMKWNPDTTTYARVTSLFYEDKREAIAFIKCVNDLQRNMHLAVAEHYSSEHFIIKAQCLMQIAMKRLQKEFYQILSTNRAHLDPESVSARSSSARASTRSSTSDYDDDSDEIRIAGDSISEVEQVSILAMDNLRLIAECMISSGYGKECHRIYTIIRKSIIDEGVYRLGVEKMMSMNQASKMDWEVQDMTIKNWLKAVKIAMRTLFTGEKILCDHVFASSESIRESCFAEISKDGALILFGFPEFIAKSKKSPEKMFRALDMYTAISEQWIEIESIFSSESTSAVRSQALNSLIKLGDSVRTMLSEFESTLQKDSSKSPVPGGGIHHLTIDVMNYLTNLADYGSVLSDIILSPPEKAELPVSYFESSSDSDDAAPAPPPLVVHFAWLILVLLCKLDGKSKHHKQDASLSYLFLANNLQYIVSKVRRSNLKYILGDEWISKQETKVKQFAANYERLGWSHVYSSLPKNPAAAEMKADEAKEHFKQFNSRFEEARKRQSSCIVPDARLRDEIRVSIAKKILPVYRDLYNAHRFTVGGERNIRVFVRFTPEDVGNCLSDLFYGNGESVSASSSSTPSPSNRRFFQAR